MHVNLTPNAIAAIYGGDVNLKPLVQVLDIKLLGSTQARYRFLISDSTSSQYATLDTAMNYIVQTGAVKKGSVVQLIDYLSTTVPNRKIIIVLNMETILLECEMIGNPNLFIESKSTSEIPMPNANAFNANTYVTPNSTSFRAPVSGTFNGSSSGGFEGSKPSTYNNFGSAAYGGPNPSTRSGAFRGPSPATFRPSDAGNGGHSFGSTVQQPYQPSPSYKNHGSIEALPCVIPISALSPYQGQWTIKARVTGRCDMDGGHVKMSCFHLLDSHGGKIKLKCFNAVFDRFYGCLKVGKVYLISKGNLMPAEKKINRLSNEWEIFLETTSTVELCPDDGSIPTQQFFFRPISDIENAENNALFDVIGVVIFVNPSVPILRNGKGTQKRNLNMKDKSGRSVEVTLWGEICNKEGQKLQEMVDAGMFPILAVKAGKVNNDCSLKSIWTTLTTLLFINPEIPEADELREWFDRVGKNAACVSISKEFTSGETRKTVSQIKDEGLGRPERPDWITVRAVINFIRSDNFCYTACPLMIGDRQCNKKVTRSGNRWRCSRCNQEFDECDYRYSLQGQIQDQTGVTWVTASQEAGEEIMGCPAKALYFMKYWAQDEIGFGELIRSRVFNQYLFKLKVEEELYGDEQRVNVTIIKADQLNYSAETRYLLHTILRSRKY